MFGKLILVGILIIIYTYRSVTNRSDQIDSQKTTRAPTKYEEQNYMQEHNLIKIQDCYVWYGVKENGEVKPITDQLERNCHNDFCKIENYFNYVKNIPYQEGEKNKDKNAVDILMKGKGDCDEKSYLLASMALQGKYQSIMIYTKDHAFLGINIPNYATNEKRSYLEINNRKYYYADSINKASWIGAYNGIDPKEYKFVYNVNERKEIPMSEIKAKIYL